MAPRNGVKPQATAKRKRLQEKLREGCKLGDLSEVALALKPKASLWWRCARTLLSYLGTTSKVGQGPSEEAADLGWSYDDDLGNMPVHYIALGSKPTLTSAVMALFCLKPAAALSSDAQRAELLRWLLDGNHTVDLSAVNARLQTPVHCALQSQSLEVLEVLLTHVPANGAQRQAAGISSRDSKHLRPLDVALMTQQWPAVRLLISAGSLHTCPELTDAQRQLQQLLLLPDSRRQSGAFLLLKGALGKAAGLVWKQGDAKSKQHPAEPTAEAAELQEALPGTRGKEEDSALPESRVLVLESPQEIYHHRQASIQRLAHMLNTRDCTAQRLLNAQQWDSSAAIRVHLEHEKEALQSNGVAPEGRIDAGPVKADNTESATARLQPCNVCFEETRSSSVGTLPCRHHTCDSCLKGILLASMDEGDLDRCACPLPNCRTKLPDQAAQQLLRGRQLERFQHLAAHSYANRSPTTQWCPRPGCGRCVALDDQGEASNSAAAAVCARRALNVRCSCGERFCLSCGAAPHEPAPCAAVREWHAMLRDAQKAAESQSESWVTKHTKPCTGCGAPIQRNGGCNHITCSQCHGHFCWVCGRDWKEHSSSTGGYYSCNRFVPDGAVDTEPSGIRAFLSSLYGRVQDAAQQYRLEHYLRRYHAQDCDEQLLNLSADWMAALLSAGVPTKGCHAAAVGLRQLLQPSEAAQGRPVAWALSQGSAGDYAYLAQAAAEVVSARKVLANSYIAAYAMPWTDRKRQFEETQGRLEAAVEQCSLPLALVPSIQAVSEAAAREAKTNGNEAPLKGSGSRNKLPLEVSDGNVVRQQFYHALGVHSMAEQMRSLIRVVLSEKKKLRQMARQCNEQLPVEGSNASAPRSSSQRAHTAPNGRAERKDSGLGIALHTAASAVASWLSSK